MNFNDKQMKTIATLFLLIVLLVQKSLNAQNIKSDSIYWDDGRVSLLSQLGPIWIIVKQGSDKKDVRIIEIKKEKGILVYEKEKCLHDIAIHNIKMIQPGKHPLSYMLFYPDNTPYIKREYFTLDALVNYSDFKYISGIAIRPVETPVQKVEINTSGFCCDTLIEESGTIRLVKIVEVDPKFVTYRTARGNSPIYVKCTNNASIRRYKTCITVNFSMK
jgi:hypothetical protein